MQTALINATLFWALLMVVYGVLGFIVSVVPGVVTRTVEYQQQSARWFRRLPLIAVGLWVVLFVINLVMPISACRLCPPGTPYPWM